MNKIHPYHYIPLISCIITTHNREKLLPRALKSVVNQSYKNKEIIVVDDFSTDNTEKIIQQLQRKFIFKYIRNDKNKGAPYSRNIGASVAEGEFLIFLDDDDEWDINRLEILLENYEHKYSYVASLNKTVARGKSIVYGRKKIITLNNILYANYSGSHPLILTSRFNQIGGFDEALDSSQDWDLHIRMIHTFGNAKIVQKPLYIAHEVENSISHKRNKDGKLRVIEKHKHKMNYFQKKFNECIFKKKGKKLLMVERLLCLPIGIPLTEYINMYKTFVFQRLCNK